MSSGGSQPSAEARLKELEDALRLVWGAMLLAGLEVPDNKRIQAAFQKADKVCRDTGLMAQAGCSWIETECHK